jgi:tripartite-type tricarboxylate transporter receptor subunit TctC
MKRSVTRRVLLAAALFAPIASGLASPAAAQDFPSRAVRIIVPFPPGGSAEQQARLLAVGLTDLWKQPVIIENKPGAGATLGAAFAASATPDGHTLFFASTSHTITPSLYPSLPYHPVQSFAPISMVSISPLIITVPAEMKVSNLAEFIALAKANPGKFNYATSGTGGSPHLAGELFRIRANIDVTHIPTKGTAPALTALLGGHVDYMIADMSAVPHYRAGKLKPLAVSTPRRSPLLPDVPTMSESGLRDAEVSNWGSILAPAKTPNAIVVRINEATRQVLGNASVRERYAVMGFETAPSTPAELEAHMRAEVAKYADVIKSAGIKQE